MNPEQVEALLHISFRLTLPVLGQSLKTLLYKNNVILSDNKRCGSRASDSKHDGDMNVLQALYAAYLVNDNLLVVG